MKDKMLNEYWKILCQIHILTKKYYILSEELNIEMKTIVQPIKEQRDALEHIVRVYSSLMLDNQIVQTYKDVDRETYIRANMEKAIGHEYRAFFDAIDYITISIRENIYKEINKYEQKDLINVFPKYIDFKEKLLEIPLKIANMREKKDVAGNMLETARAYAELTDELMIMYRELSSATCKIN